MNNATYFNRAKRLTTPVGFALLLLEIDNREVETNESLPLLKRLVLKRAKEKGFEL